jgi:hypothetical protein
MTGPEDHKPYLKEIAIALNLPCLRENDLDYLPVHPEELIYHLRGPITKLRVADYGRLIIVDWRGNRVGFDWYSTRYDVDSFDSDLKRYQAQFKGKKITYADTMTDEEIAEFSWQEPVWDRSNCREMLILKERQ